MPTADFSSCIARLDWAVEALHALHEEIGRWFAENDIYESTVEYHPEADIHAFRLVGKIPPWRLGVVIGNIVHQVRASLDNLVWQLVIANKRKPRSGTKGNAFPILTWEDPHRSWAARTANTLHGVHPDHRALIEGLQPYLRPSGRDPAKQHPLGILAGLSNRDKHQILQLMATVQAAEVEWAVSFTGEFDSTAAGGLLPVDYLNAGAIVAWAQLVPSGFHADVSMQTLAWLQLWTRPPGDARGAGIRIQVEPELCWITANVRAIVDAFLPVATGDKAEPISMEINAQHARFQALNSTSPWYTPSGPPSWKEITDNL